MNASSVNWRNKIHDKMKQGTIEHVITVKSSNHAERMAVVFIRIFRISACLFFLSLLRVIKVRFPLRKKLEKNYKMFSNKTTCIILNGQI